MRFTFPRVHNSCSPPRDILQILSFRLKQREHGYDVWNESNNDSRLLIPRIYWRIIEYESPRIEIVVILVVVGTMMCATLHEVEVLTVITHWREL